MREVYLGRVFHVAFHVKRRCETQADMDGAKFRLERRDDPRAPWVAAIEPETGLPYQPFESWDSADETRQSLNRILGHEYRIIRIYD